MEDPRPSHTVEPSPSYSNAACSGRRSRPGPVSGNGEGVFQPPVVGEYPVSISVHPLCPHVSSTFSTDSTPAVRAATPSDLSVYYQNVRGLRTKIDDLFLSVIGCDYDIIVLTETWLNDEIHSPQLFGSKYCVYRNDRDTISTGKKTGGGVCIAVSTKFSSSAHPLPPFDRRLEQLWVVIEGTETQKTYVGAAYISPELATRPWFIEAHINSVSAVAEILRPNDTHILLGDYNQPHISWTRSPTHHAIPSPLALSFPESSSSLLDGMALVGMKQMNTIRNNLNRTLDLVLVNDDAASNCTVSLSPEALIEADPPHPPLLVELQCSLPIAFDDQSDNRLYNLNKTDFPAMNRALQNFDWSFIEATQDVNQAVAFFNDTLHALFRQFVPAPGPRYNPSWSNERLQKLKRRRAAALRRYSSIRNPYTKHAFCVASNRYNHYKRYLYSKHVKRTQLNLKRNPKRFWSFVNEKRKETGLPSSMFLGDTTSNSTEHTCNLFAEHFSSVFHTTTATTEQINNALRYVPENIVHLNVTSFSEEDVKAAIVKLKSSSSFGPDGIPSIVLKKCAEVLATPLRLIFNLSIRTELFPECWKTSYMFPAFKKGNKRDISNYRGITSLCAGSKLMEILVSQLLLRAVKTYISTEQHGFFPGRSTNTNLVEFTSFCLRNMDGGGQVDAVYTDLKAAFDRVDHRILLAKLDRLGISCHLVRWIASFLNNRSLTVRLGSSESVSFRCPSGVPQGSNIGPLFFSVFVNDASLVLPSGCRMLYADDLKIFKVVNSPNHCQNLQELINLFTEWCELNLLSLSVPKCSVISFTRKRNPVVWPYSIGTEVLTRVSVVKDLGVLLDDKLNFTSHYNSTLAKANRNLGFMSRVAKEFRDPMCLRALYYALVRSHLESAVVVWSPYTDAWIVRIESVQRKFTRYALRFHAQPGPAGTLSYEQRCQVLGLTTLSKRRIYLRAAFIGKILLGAVDAPNILARININVIPRPLRERNFLRLDFHETQYGQNEPVRAMCHIFNSVYFVFDYSMSIDTFLFSLRRTIFN